MPVKHAIWTTGDSPKPLAPSKLGSEQQLEDMIVHDPSILSSEWMLIGRQELTKFGGRIDLLGMAPDGSLVLIELKRDRTPREIIAQALDYASWVEDLDARDLVDIYQRFSGGGLLDQDFANRFGHPLDEDLINDSHQIVIVAAELDDSTERIVTYLNDRDIAINVVFFQVFENGDQKLLSRAWLIDPSETQANVATTAKQGGEKEPWNGEYYVSFGPPEHRLWEEARKYGFISAGGGSWYSQTLKLLSPGDRVWVKVPRTGYVGVGRVTETVRPVTQFVVSTDQGDTPALDALHYADRYRKSADDPDTCEYFVRVDWLDTVDEANAVNEVGLFGNQNTVCQPKTPKWRATIERLKSHFKSWDS